MLESQSKTVNLLQPSVPQVPLFLHPLGCPSFPVEQLLQPIFFYLDLVKKYSILVQKAFVKLIEGKDTTFLT